MISGAAVLHPRITERDLLHNVYSVTYGLILVVAEHMFTGLALTLDKFTNTEIIKINYIQQNIPNI